MPFVTKPIEQRPGYREEDSKGELQRDLNALATKHGLLGCVLVEFTRDYRVGVRSCGVTDEFCDAMDALGSGILRDVDDGRHDPLKHVDADGTA